MRTALYPGSFDPPTEGHVNIVERGLALFEKIIIVVAENSQKKSRLSVEERVSLLKEIFSSKKNVEVDSFCDRLLVDYARSRNCPVVLRGLRTFQDYEYEFQMALANKQLMPEIETVFIMADSRYSYLSSSLMREILDLGGSGKGLVPPIVEKRFKENRS